MTDGVDLHLGARLRNRRKDLGLTLTDVAAAADMRFRQLQKYELGQHRIPASTLYRLAVALATEVQYFYDGLTAPSEETETEPSMVRALQ
jgi:transcriptional regulator with XRE-family HTH domain